MYLQLFRRFGRATDLSKLATPPDDVFDYFCQCLRQQEGKNHTPSRDIFQLRWAQLPDSQKTVYKSERETVAEKQTVYQYVRRFEDVCLCGRKDEL